MKNKAPIYCYEITLDCDSDKSIAFKVPLGLQNNPSSVLPYLPDV